LGILDKIFKRDKAPSRSAEDDERFKRMAAEPPVSAAQEQANRDIMEGQVADEGDAVRDIAEVIGRRLGVPVAVRGELVQRSGETLLLELEAPIAKLPIVEELYAAWVKQVAGNP
jgi:hypothetical protein